MNGMDGHGLALIVTIWEEKQHKKKLKNMKSV